MLRRKRFQRQIAIPLRKIAHVWLPLCQNAPMLANGKQFTSKFLKNHKKKEWFLGLAHAMHNIKDPQQAKMLIKIFLFLHNYMPRELTGNYAHLWGSEVINYCLSLKEQAASRHRVTKKAKAAWNKLEAWMSQGRDWKEALQRFKELKKKGGKRAPGLCLPAAIMAILVLAYPKTKRKKRIARLGIKWIISPRGTLDVRDGFWSGLTINNLYTCFAPAKPLPKAQTKLLLNYNCLFGQQFVVACIDMRPILPAWAGTVTREDKLLNLNLSNKEQEKCKNPILVLQAHFAPYTTKNMETLKSWLTGKLSGDLEVVMRWIKHWANRINKAKTYENQTIMRSLFSQSLQRLYSLCTAKDREAMGFEAADLEAAYMLLNIKDGLTRTGDQTASTAPKKLVSLPGYYKYAAVTAQLLQLGRLCGKAVHNLLSSIFNQQSAFFH